MVDVTTTELVLGVDVIAELVIAVVVDNAAVWLMVAYVGIVLVASLVATIDDEVGTTVVVIISVVGSMSTTDTVEVDTTSVVGVAVTTTVLVLVTGGEVSTTVS